MRNISKITNSLSLFREKKILIIGDLILDQYTEGEIARLNPEEVGAPLIRVGSDNYVLGGAANVANNIVSLGGKATLCGLVNENDSAGKEFIKICKKQGIELIYFNDHRPTTIKQRIMSRNRQMARIDREETSKISEELSYRILEELNPLLREYDGIIFSDYNKGLATLILAEQLIKASERLGIKNFIDAKPENAILFKGAYMFTPNLREAEQISAIKMDSDESIDKYALKAAKSIYQCMNVNQIIITLGEYGIAYFDSINNYFCQVPTFAKDVYDVSGAGDTVVATLCLATISGLDCHEAVQLANVAAGFAVSKVGTYAVTVEDVLKHISSIDFKTLYNKDKKDEPQ